MTTEVKNSSSCVLCTKDIGRKIRERRRGIHMTMEELGRKVGISGQQIGKYETDVDSPGLRRLYAIADVLQISVYELLPSPNDKNISEEGRPLVGFIQVQKADLGYLMQITECFGKVKSRSLKEKMVDIVTMMGK